MSKSILEKNLEAMEKWYPAFADLIREEHETEDPTNVMVENRAGRTTALFRWQEKCKRTDTDLERESRRDT